MNKPQDPQPPILGGRTEQQFHSVMAECRSLFAKKLHDYGASWRILRPSSLTDQLFIKAKRIRSLEVKKVSKVGEGIRPEFIALINYGIVGLVQLELGYVDEVDMSPELLTWYLRGLAAQGIFDAVRGILVGRPARRNRWEDYKAVYRRVVGMECGRPDLPILGNMNFGHAEPIGVFPLGVRTRLDTEAKTITLLESATE